jgi:ABC-type transporter Mla MlaB component
MFRITKIAAENETGLRLVGHLSADDVAVLERACRNVSWPLLLDLSDLRNADDSGLAAIREIVERGAELINVTPFTALLLEGEEPRGYGS